VQFRIDRKSDACWTVTFDHPPLNLLDPETIKELHDLLGMMIEDVRLEVVVFDSADRDFFIAHDDMSRASQTPPAAADRCDADEDGVMGALPARAGRWRFWSDCIAISLRHAALAVGIRACGQIGTLTGFHFCEIVLAPALNDRGERWTTCLSPTPFSSVSRFSF
jgi:hypothetical protein